MWWLICKSERTYNIGTSSALPVRLATDAPPYGIGGVLSHVMEDGTERPIAYASRTLTKAEKAYSQIDKINLTVRKLTSFKWHCTKGNATWSCVIASTGHCITRNMWFSQGNDFKPYRNRSKELTVHQNCLLSGDRVIVPTSQRGEILKELHEIKVWNRKDK